MSEKARLSTKSQLVVPKRIRERLGLKPGDTVVFAETPEGVRIERAAEEDDPFGAFQEWASEADDEAYAAL